MSQAKINLNDSVKVKLTDLGKDIYYHRYDELNRRCGRIINQPMFPEEDAEGYAEFQLWDFIQLYGGYIGMARPNVIEPLNIVFEIDDAAEALQLVPAANVVASDCYDRLLAENDRLREERPVTHGYWKRERNGFLYCSVCGAVSPAEDMYEEDIVCPKYCHVCGSVMDMKGVESDE